MNCEFKYIFVFLHIGKVQNRVHTVNRYLNESLENIFTLMETAIKFLVFKF